MPIFARQTPRAGLDVIYPSRDMSYVPRGPFPSRALPAEVRRKLRLSEEQSVGKRSLQESASTKKEEALQHTVESCSQCLSRRSGLGGGAHAQTRLLYAQERQRKSQGKVLHLDRPQSKDSPSRIVSEGAHALTGDLATTVNTVPNTAKDSAPHPQQASDVCVRPQPAEQRLMMRVVGATGLPASDSLDSGLPDVYCVGEIPHKPSWRFETQCLKSLNPTWNYDVEVAGWAPGDSILLSVQDKTTLDESLGKVVLESSLLAHGFYKGELPLVQLNGKCEGAIFVEATVLGPGAK